MALPMVRTVQDIETVMRFNRRWRRRQRILALRACVKTLNTLRMAEKVSAGEAAVVRKRLLPMLKQEERIHRMRDGKVVERPGEVVVAEINATEKAVQLAELKGIDLESVTGTGKDGRIVVGDVTRHAREREGVS